MVMILGEAVELPSEERRALNAEPNPTWPYVHAKLGCRFDEFLRLFPCNHIFGVVGSHIRSLIYLYEMAEVELMILEPEAQKRVPPIWERVSK